MIGTLWRALCLLGSVPFAATPLSFTAPACGQIVAGTLSLSVADSSGKLARVDYAMGSHPIASLQAPGFETSWNSAEAMDGVSAIQARGYDALGNPLAAAECLVQISNRQASLVVNSPDLTQILSGTVHVSVTGADALAFPAVWTLNIDGEEQSTVWTDNSWTTPLTVAFNLDTTRFTNGAHELHISMNSRSGPQNPQWVNWRGMVNRVIQINNGHTWMDSSALFQNVYLQPGQQLSLGCARSYTDSQAPTPCASATYQSSNPAIASVDTNGLVLGAQSGFAQITVSDGPRGSTANIWVSPDSRIPHFQGNGVIRQGYDPGQSLFLIAPFFLDPPSLTQNSGLQDEARRAGINTLGFGVYLNPRDVTTAYDSWQASFNQSVLPNMQWAQANGFHLLLTGDDIFRNIGTDAWYTLNWPYGQQAVQYAVGQMAATGVGVGIEAIDEVSSIWGDRPVPEGLIGQASYLFNGVDCVAGLCSVNWPQNPLPNGWNFAFRADTGIPLASAPGSLFTAQDSTSDGFTFQAASSVNGSFTPANAPSLDYLWFAGKYCAGGTVCNPAVPNEALARMRSWMQVSPPVSVTFPPLATSPPAVHGNWMGPGSLSDYASDYFTSLKTRTTYPWSEGIQEMTCSMASSFFSRQPYLMLNRPQLMLVSLAGPSYTKQSQGTAIYQPGIDSLDQPGVSPQHVSAIMMEAAALGGAGLRLYYFEPPTDYATRASAPLGSYFQTGANPTNLQPASWRAMSYAANLLAGVLQPFLLGSGQTSPAYGRNIVTAVRTGAAGTMLMIVNGNDWERTIPVDFTAFPHSFGVARYRLETFGIQTSQLPANSTGDSITLGPGQTAAYLFPDSAAAMPLQSVTIPASGQVQGVRFGYIYPGSSTNQSVTACTTSCSVAIDPRLGPVFYQFAGPGIPNTESELTRSQLP